MANLHPFMTNERVARPDELRLAIINYLAQVDWRYFVTLTFACPIAERTAQGCFDAFYRRLNNKLFGKRSKKRLRIAFALEANYADGLHYHFLMEDPSLRTERPEAQRVRELVQEIWESVDGPTGFIRKSCPDGHSWFKDVEAPWGVSAYLTKQLRWRPDTIQWDQTNL